MHLKYRNVNDAFRDLVASIHRASTHTPGGRLDPFSVSEVESRNGPVLMVNEPVLITYMRPIERVLFNTARDANPFFHLFEALWMLAGRRDVAPLARYAKNILNYSDDGVTLNGAYGYRWRNHQQRVRDSTGLSVTDVDQLGVIVDHLKADPDSRRAVLQMWNVEDDLLKVGPARRYDDSDPQQALAEVMDTSEYSKDVCCNLSVMFLLRRADEEKTIGWSPHHAATVGYGRGWVTHPMNYRLDMTVTNRSNDMIWGLLGANYVHFTFLQEYMAARLGVGVGLYHHFTNNLHVYKSNWKPEEWVASSQLFNPYVAHDYGVTKWVAAVPPHFETVPLDGGMGSSMGTFDKILPRFVDWHSWAPRASLRTWGHPFFDKLAGPMLRAYAVYKNGGDDQGRSALAAAEEIADGAWRTASISWLTKRLQKERA